MSKEHPSRKDWWKSVRIVAAVVGALYAGVLLYVVQANQTEYHAQTIATLKAENCTSAKCESPAVKAVISQAITGVAAAVTTANTAELQLLCYSLASLNQANPSAAAATALHRYCQPSTSTSTGGTP